MTGTTIESVKDDLLRSFFNYLHNHDEITHGGFDTALKWAQQNLNQQARCTRPPPCDRGPTERLRTHAIVGVEGAAPGEVLRAQHDRHLENVGRYQNQTQSIRRSHVRRLAAAAPG